MPFITSNRVQMYDTDAAGIIYFASQFRYAHDAFEQIMQSIGYNFTDLLEKEPFIFVIVHAEADYFAPLKVGDLITVETRITRIGETSFTLDYQLSKEGKIVGRCQTVHVCLDKHTRKKQTLPAKPMSKLRQYYVPAE